MSSFAASAHYDLLRQRCYSNKVTTARIITTSSMAYSGAYATHHHAWWKSNVSGTERLKQNVLSLQSEQPSISTYHRPSIWDLPSCICTNRLIGTLWFSLVDLSPTSSVCCNWNTSVLLLLCSSIDCNGTVLRRCSCSSIVAVPVLALSPSHDALEMRQQRTFRVMNLRHHHNHNHHHCDNEKTPNDTWGCFCRPLQRRQWTYFHHHDRDRDNGHIDNASVCIILNVLFYQLTSLCQEQQQWTRGCERTVHALSKWSRASCLLSRASCLLSRAWFSRLRAHSCWYLPHRCNSRAPSPGLALDRYVYKLVHLLPLPQYFSLSLFALRELQTMSWLCSDISETGRRHAWAKMVCRDN